MATPSGPDIDPIRAATAAGAVAWRVQAGAPSIEVTAWGAGSPHSLIGTWGIEEFSRQFDGLHRKELVDVLIGASGRSNIDLVILLASGERAHLRGRGDRSGAAEGLLYLEPAGVVAESPLCIEAVFQPIVRLTGRAVAGYECLARLRQEDGALVAVDSAHAVVGIGPTMARQAVAFLDDAERRRQGLFVNINLSAFELGDPAGVRQIADVIAGCGAAPGQVRVELTEQAALREWGAVRESLRVLRGAGAGIVLDDFGAGHSSMVWLSELEFAGVKLDAGLLRNLRTQRGRLILERLLSLLGELGVEVVVEGVEDLAAIPALIELGGELAQGFALGEPVSAAQIDAGAGAG